MSIATHNATMAMCMCMMRSRGRVRSVAE